ncbi:MAG: PAS domain S-box protein [Deltaproteobacteria bacterium]|nr:MAG: PAS domain S-box protein [Deltaproteobacteria bacterium]
MDGPRVRHELNAAGLSPAEQLRAAQDLLGFGSWHMNLDTGEVHWSDAVYVMLGAAPGGLIPTRESYLSRVHPDDVQPLLDDLEAVIGGSSERFSSTHRILAAEGAVRYVESLGVVEASDRGRILAGVVRDVTDRVAATQRLADLEQLRRFAGETSKLGGWRVEVGADRVIWTEECAAIHGVPAGTCPTLERAIAFYIPQDRPRIAEAFRQCVERGIPYDDQFTILNAAGQRVRVRTTGLPFHDDRGRIKGVHGALQDLTGILRAQEQVEALNLRLAHVLETMSDAFITLDHEGCFTYLNQQAEVALGQRREELLGAHIWTAFPQEPGSPFVRAYDLARRDRRRQEHVSWYEALQKWFSVVCEPTPNGVAVFFRDVTQEQARTEQLRLLEAAVARVNDILILTEVGPAPSAEGPRIVYVNDAFVDQLGYRRDEVLGQSVEILRDPNTPEHGLGPTLRSPPSVSERTQVLHHRRDQRELWLELDVVPLLGDEGRPTHHVAVARDITDRKLAEERVRIANARFDTIALITEDVVWDWDLERDAFWWSDGLYKHFGYDPQTFGTSFEAWEERIVPEDRARAAAGIKAAIEGHASSWTEEYRFFHADGRVRIVIDRGSIHRDERGRAVRMVGSTIDVTEQRAMQAQLRQAEKMQAIGQLTGGVAHDFNNLLTVILGNIELLSERTTQQHELHRLANEAMAAAERGAALTSRLLAFARRQPLEPKAIDVNQLLRRSDHMFRRTLPEDIEIETVAAAGLWLADVDPGQLENALLNLALNARDAMPRGGRLTFETANVRIDEDYAANHDEVSPGPYVLVSVSDTGHGMSPETVQRAFEPFYTTKGSGRGSGMGLSMVFGFIKQSGGHVKIYSEPGEGTSVKLYLPRSHAQKPSPADTPSYDIRGGHEHILVVEDDRHVRDHLERQLRSLGYRVSTAASGREALDLLQANPTVELLFTDVVMPGGMSGPQLAARVRERSPDIGILYTSGYTENAIVHQGRLDEGVHLLTKPYNRQALARKVRKALDEPGPA